MGEFAHPCVHLLHYDEVPCRLFRLRVAAWSLDKRLTRDGLARMWRKGVLDRPPVAVARE